MWTPCGDSMVVVRVPSERVVVGISGSEMVAMVSANQDSVVWSRTALPGAEGHSWQVFSPVRSTMQLGHCHARESQRLLVILMCFWMARPVFPSSQK